MDVQAVKCLIATYLRCKTFNDSADAVITGFVSDDDHGALFFAFRDTEGDSEVVQCKQTVEECPVDEFLLIANTGTSGMPFIFPVNATVDISTIKTTLKSMLTGFSTVPAFQLNSIISTVTERLSGVLHNSEFTTLLYDLDEAPESLLSEEGYSSEDCILYADNWATIFDRLMKEVDKSCTIVNSLKQRHHFFINIYRDFQVFSELLKSDAGKKVIDTAISLDCESGKTFERVNDLHRTTTYLSTIVAVYDEFGLNEFYLSQDLTTLIENTQRILTNLSQFPNQEKLECLFLLQLEISTMLKKCLRTNVNLLTPDPLLNKYLGEVSDGDLFKVCFVSSQKSFFGFCNTVLQFVLELLEHMRPLFRSQYQKLLSITQNMLKRRGVHGTYHFNVGFNSIKEYFELIIELRETFHSYYKFGVDNDCFDRFFMVLKELSRVFTADVLSGELITFNKLVHARDSFVSSLKPLDDVLLELLSYHCEQITTSADIFGVFERFQSVRERPVIRSALSAYQRQFLPTLIQEVKRLKTIMFNSSDSYGAAIRATGLYSYDNNVSLMQTKIIVKHRVDTLVNKLNALLGTNWRFAHSWRPVAADINNLIEVTASTQVASSVVESINSTIEKVPIEMKYPLIRVDTGSMELHTVLTETIMNQSNAYKNYELFRRVTKSTTVFPAQMDRQLKTASQFSPVLIGVDISLKCFNNLMKEIQGTNFVSLLSRSILSTRYHVDRLAVVKGSKGRDFLMGLIQANFQQLCDDLIHHIHILLDMHNSLKPHVQRINTGISELHDPVFFINEWNRLVKNGHGHLFGDHINEIQSEVLIIKKKCAVSIEEFVCNINERILAALSKHSSLFLNKLMYQHFDIEELEQDASFENVEKYSFEKAKVQRSSLDLTIPFRFVTNLSIDRSRNRVAIDPPALEIEGRMLSTIMNYFNHIGGITKVSIDDKLCTFNESLLGVPDVNELLKKAFSCVFQISQRVSELLKSWHSSLIIWQIYPDNLSLTTVPEVKEFFENVLQVKNMIFNQAKGMASTYFGAVKITRSGFEARLMKGLVSHLQILAEEPINSIFIPAVGKIHTELNDVKTNMEQVHQWSSESQLTSIIPTLVAYRRFIESQVEWREQLRSLKQLEDIFFSNDVDGIGLSFDVIEGNYTSHNAISLLFSAIETLGDTIAGKISEYRDDLQDMIFNTQNAMSARLDTLTAAFKGSFSREFTQKEIISCNTFFASLAKHHNDSVPLESLESDFGDLYAIVPSVVTSRVDEYAKEADVISETIEIVKSVRSLIGLPADPTVSSLLQNCSAVVKDLSLLADAFDYLQKPIQIVCQLFQGAFRSRLVEQLRQQTTEGLRLLSLSSMSSQNLSLYVLLNAFLTQFKNTLNLISELQSDSFSSRHWSTVNSALKLGCPVFANVTMAKLLEFGLTDPSSAFRVTLSDVLKTAVGEAAIQTFIDELNVKWNQETSLEFRNLHGDENTLLIINLNLVDEINEDLSHVEATKHSPYVRVFESFIQSWNANLTSLRDTLELVTQIQQLYVYLYGVFMRNKGAVHPSLRQHTKTFTIIDKELQRIFHGLRDDDIIMAIKTPANLQTFEQMLVSLQSVRQSLTQFLETQRSAFPRFYFIGNDDLLQLLSNSDMPHLVTKHLSKLFVGLSGLTYDESKRVITAVQSSEGEYIDFGTNGIPITDSIEAITWLSQIEALLKKRLKDDIIAIMDTLPESALELQAIDVLKLTHSHTFQSVMVSIQVLFTKLLESITENTATEVLNCLKTIVSDFSTIVVDSPLQHKYQRNLIIEAVYVESIIAEYIATGYDANIIRNSLRFYVTKTKKTMLKKASCDVKIRIGVAELDYGFEYVGVPERLVVTPLTRQVFFNFCTSLHFKYGCSPFGPAGTGKTESVKDLSRLLGRPVSVFCCDDSFDLNAMSRIFVGLCALGALGCFDEFNRLEVSTLSEVSQEIIAIQTSLKNKAQRVDLIRHKNIALNNNVGIFVTANIGYAGRSELPDNLKALFRPCSMEKPDKALIVDILLLSEGFGECRGMSTSIVGFFETLKRCLSQQAHYDFGLRALKAALKTASLLRASDSEGEIRDILINGISTSIQPKLTRTDQSIFALALNKYFNVGVEEVYLTSSEITHLISSFKDELILSDDTVKQLSDFQHLVTLSTGVILLGETCSGKSSLIKIYESLQQFRNIPTIVHHIPVKTLTKHQLYGELNEITVEWVDGLFTSILREVNDTNDFDTVHLCVFDGGIDPIWVESLNSVLDDNKTLTLPTGEHLRVPPNFTLVFEVNSLEHATLATVSRNQTLHLSASNNIMLSIVLQFILHIKSVSTNVAEALSQLVFGVDCGDLDPQYLLGNPDALSQFDTSLIASVLNSRDEDLAIMEITTVMILQRWLDFIDATARPNIHGPSVVADALYNALCSFLNVTGHQAVNMQVTSLFESMSLPINIELGTGGFEGDIFVPYLKGIEEKNSANMKMAQAASIGNVLIETTDTKRTTHLLTSLNRVGVPLVMCGPPGSGKSLSVNHVFGGDEATKTVTLSFSAGTGCEYVVNTLLDHCTLSRDSTSSLILSPMDKNITRLLIFCDEVNLIEPDMFGNRPVLSLLRFALEHHAVYVPSQSAIVKLHSSIQFVCACNPPSMRGRRPLPSNLLRHVAVMYVGFPSTESMCQIYSFMFHTALKTTNHVDIAPKLAKYAVSVYEYVSKELTVDLQPHYSYSPRELTRICRGLHQVVTFGVADTMDLSNIQLELNELRTKLSLDYIVLGLVQELFRVFIDRIITADERDDVVQCITQGLRENFPEVATHIEGLMLNNDVIFSSLQTGFYQHVSDTENIRRSLIQRLMTVEGYSSNDLVLFDTFISHMTRIDRVLRQASGHLILLGAPGLGKSLITEFIASVLDYSVFMLPISAKYTLHDFEENLKDLLRRTGVNREKIIFVFNLDTDSLSSAFLEYMNALLASGEIPGIFNESDWDALFTELHSKKDRSSIALLNEEQKRSVYHSEFVTNVQECLHVVFMSAADVSPTGRIGLDISPALLNRCVIDHFFDWSATERYQLAELFMNRINLPADFCCRVLNKNGTPTVQDLQDLRQKLADLMCEIHGSIENATPRAFCTFISNTVDIVQEVVNKSLEQQSHLEAGLLKMTMAGAQIAHVQEDLAEKRKLLNTKEEEADIKLAEMTSAMDHNQRAEKESRELASLIHTKSAYISEQSQSVRSQLSAAEPAIAEAKSSLEAIDRRSIDEVRRLANPPSSVKATLACIVAFLYGKGIIDDWGTLRRDVKPEIIHDILTFDAARSRVSSDTIRAVMRLIEKHNLTKHTITRASVPAGTIFGWMEAQLKYMTIFAQVKPLRLELQKLEAEARDLSLKKKDVDTDLQHLVTTLKTLRDDFDALTIAKQSIADQIRKTESNILRATQLFGDLSGEQKRWQAELEQFSQQEQFVMANALTMASYVSFAGSFTHEKRQQLVVSINSIFKKNGFNTAKFPIVERLLELSNRDFEEIPHAERENVSLLLMASYTNTVPLIIDPADNNETFTRVFGSDIQITSFIDDTFKSKLTSALRFGLTLVVKNTERFDPIVLPIIEDRVKIVDGKRTIKVGEDVVNVSPSFRLVLSTTDSSIDTVLCSSLLARLAVVNYTMTGAALGNRALIHILKCQEPQLFKERDVLMSQEISVAREIRSSEDKLLMTLVQSSGDLLSDNVLLDTLSELKTKVSELEESSSVVRNSLIELEAQSNIFAPCSKLLGNVYECLQSFSTINPLYFFSLNALWHVFDSVVTYKFDEGISADERNNELSSRFVTNAAKHFEHSFVNYNDKLLFFLSLSLVSDNVSRSYVKNFTQFNTEPVLSGIDSTYAELYEQVKANPAHYASIVDNHISTAVGVAPGANPLQAIEARLNSVTGREPVLVISNPGFDMSGAIEQFLTSSDSVNQKVVALACGLDRQLLQDARMLLAKSASSGHILIFKNVQLVPGWVDELLHFINTKKLHKSFRLILTSELGVTFPESVLLSCHKFVFQAEKSHSRLAHRLFNMIPSQLLQNTAVGIRLQLLLTWVHSLFVCRSEFGTYGWHKVYDFSVADFEACLTFVDSVIPKDRISLSLEDLSLSDIFSALYSFSHGGRIVDTFDKKVFLSHVNELLNSSTIEGDLSLQKEPIPLAPTFDSVSTYLSELENINDSTTYGFCDDINTVKLLAESQEFFSTLHDLSLRSKAEDIREEAIIVSKDAVLEILSSLHNTLESAILQCTTNNNNFRSHCVIAHKKFSSILLNVVHGLISLCHSQETHMRSSQLTLLNTVGTGKTPSQITDILPPHLSNISSLDVLSTFVEGITAFLNEGFGESIKLFGIVSLEQLLSSFYIDVEGPITEEMHFLFEETPTAGKEQLPISQLKCTCRTEDGFLTSSKVATLEGFLSIVSKDEINNTPYVPLYISKGCHSFVANIHFVDDFSAEQLWRAGTYCFVSE
ncbi:hypothetical protein PCE1_001366 [Barthelona sp. PCE]